MRRRRPAALAVALTVLAQLLAAAPGYAPRAAASEFRMETEAAYVVRVSSGYVAVSIEVAFENTTPDPAGQFSLFSEVKLAVHDEIEAVRASDEDGELAVAVARETVGGDEVNVATVQLRDALRFEEEARFRVEYRLPDGDDPRQRIRSSLVVFSAWGFGTRSTVTVSLPNGYEVRVDGDPLDAELSTRGVELRSGEISDPTRWLAQITATRSGSFTTLTSAVPLAGGTADLQVRSFADDPEWGARTLALLEASLPLLEAEIGLPYPHVGPLIVTESAPTGGSGFVETPSGAEILIAFDQPAFTALHQLAHVWIDTPLVEARWIREGLASHVAASVAERLDAQLPYDPAAEREAWSDAAFPLDAWSSTADPEAERYAYAASWALVREIAAEVDDGTLRRVLERVSGGIGPYELARSDAPASGHEPLSLESRGFLDQLEGVTELALADRFAAVVFDADDTALLEPRAVAREELGALLAEAGDWGAPDDVRHAMRGWRFAEADAGIREARAWIADRDELLAEMQRLGLSAPTRLRDAYLRDGGGRDAAGELAAEAAVVRAYGAGLQLVNAERSLLARLGLVGAPDPGVQLTVANGLFAEGDLRAAVDAIEEAERQLRAAEMTGVLRAASAAAVVVLIVGLIVLLMRRQRRAARQP